MSYSSRAAMTASAGKDSASSVGEKFLTSLVRVALLPLLIAGFLFSAHVAAASVDESRERLIEWQPKKEGAVFLKNVQRKNRIPGAPRAFRNKLQRELHRVWQRELDGAPECKQVAGIQVWSLRTDGYALGNVVSNVGNSGCEAGASGAVVFWVKQQGAWKRAIESADVVKCRRLHRIEFPSELGVEQCLRRNAVVDYHQE